MRKKFFLVFNLVLVLLINGCSDKGNSRSTPRGTVQKFSDGFMEFDKAKVAASVTGDKSELEALSVFMDYMATVRDFRQAVIKKYGPAGWAHFENEGGAKLSMNLEDQRDKINSAKIEINGDKAVCTIPGETQVIHLSRENGLWYVNAGGIVNTGGTDVQKFISTWSSLAEIIRSKQNRIGQPGVTAESLDRELGVEMLPVLMNNR